MNTRSAIPIRVSQRRTAAPRRLAVHRILLLVTAAAFAQGCISSGRIEELGKKEAEKVAQQMGILRDADLERYVDAIGRKLAARSDRPDGSWTFEVVDTPEPNAFALPGGYVYVSRGLLALVNSEDELAGVIGHEIGHVTADHTEKRIRATVAASPFAIASGIAGFATAIVSPSLGRIVAGTGALATAGLIAPYSRAQENEADAIGQQMAAAAGYDPGGISYFLHTLDRELKLQADEPREPSFLDTHPVTADRVARTRERTATLQQQPGQPIARDQADLFAKIEGIVVGDDPAHGVFDENEFLHPELDLAVTFPTGWKLVNTAAAVGGLAPSEEAVLALTIAEQGVSLEALVERLESEQQDLEFERLEIRDLPAARARMSDRGRLVQVTLIGYRGDVYSIVGQSRGQNAVQYQKTFEATAGSFRALRTSERKRIEEERLRVRAARSGETPARLVERTGTSWEPERVAVVNAVETDTQLEGGRLMKLGISQPYTPRR